MLKDIKKAPFLIGDRFPAVPPHLNTNVFLSGPFTLACVTGYLFPFPCALRTPLLYFSLPGLHPPRLADESPYSFRSSTVYCIIAEIGLNCNEKIQVRKGKPDASFPVENFFFRAIDNHSLLWFNIVCTFGLVLLNKFAGFSHHSENRFL